MFKAVFILIWLLTIIPSATSLALAQLKVTAIPDEEPTELLRIYSPLANYLEQELGLKVKFIPVVDYAAAVEALAAKKVDLAWLGGFTHVQARRRGGALAVVMRQEDLTFHTKFITAKDSGIRRLSDLKGKTFTFGSVSSTSGHLMPRYFLLKHGVIPERDFKRFSYSGAHDATAKWVETGRVDAGAINEAVLAKLFELGRINRDKLRVFWTTPAYVDYNWSVRQGLDRALISRIVRAFLSLDYANPAQRKVLDLQRTKGYVMAFEQDFAEIEQAARATGLLK